MTNDPSKILNPQPFHNSTNVIVRNGHTFSTSHVGTSTLTTLTRMMLPSHVYYALQLFRNLLSANCLCRSYNCVIKFDGSSFYVKDKQTGEPLFQLKTSIELYLVSSD